MHGKIIQRFEMFILLAQSIGCQNILHSVTTPFFIFTPICLLQQTLKFNSRKRFSFNFFNDIGNPDQVIPKSMILEKISGDTPDCVESSLKVHISNLRKKLREAGGKDYIESVWGIGFKMKTLPLLR